MGARGEGLWAGEDTSFDPTLTGPGRVKPILDSEALSGYSVATAEQEPPAKIVPLEKPHPLLGSVLWEKDIVSPVDELWDAESPSAQGAVKVRR
jgi:hypothetical protein